VRSLLFTAFAAAMSLKMTLTKKSFRVLLMESAVENLESRTRKISPDSEFWIRPALEYCDEWNSEFVLLRRGGGNRGTAHAPGSGDDDTEPKTDDGTDAGAVGRRKHQHASN